MRSLSSQLLPIHDFCQKMNFQKATFQKAPRLIFHGTYHKMGTVWWMRVLERIADSFAMQLQKSNQHGDQIDPTTDIVFANHSHLPLDPLGDFTGSHMVRDPRDCIVSGYFYHLWTEESWAHVPQETFDGLSYQAYLNSGDQNSGIHEEIKRFARYVNDYGMRDWNYSDRRIIEIKYEQLLANESDVFETVFRHYGFTDRAVRKSLKMAAQCSFEKVTGRSLGQPNQNSHLRSGQPGQWRSVLTADHVDAIKDSFGDLIQQMGYEANDNW